MAVTYGFFNSVNGDRKYNAEQMSEYFRGIVNEGVFQHLDGGLAVTAGTGLAVSVASGRAIIQNRWVQNSDAMTLSISAASETYARKDAVVVRLNYSTRSIEIAVKAGTPAASPVAPSMTRNSTTYEMALAYVNVAANATSVTVTDKRSDSTVCGWVTVAQSTSGEVDAQLNAMKTGFDGVTYSSPVEMVQGCDEILQNEVNVIADDVNIYTLLTTFTEPTGYRLNESDGLCSANADYKMKKYYVSAGEVIIVNSDDRFQFQNDVPVQTTPPSNLVGRTYGSGKYILTVPTGAIVLVLSTPIQGSQASVYRASSDIDLIRETSNINSKQTKPSWTLLKKDSYRITDVKNIKKIISSTNTWQNDTDITFAGVTVTEGEQLQILVDKRSIDGVISSNSYGTCFFKDSNNETVKSYYISFGSDGVNISDGSCDITYIAPTGATHADITIFGISNYTPTIGDKFYIIGACVITGKAELKTVDELRDTTESVMLSEVATMLKNQHENDLQGKFYGPISKEYIAQTTTENWQPKSYAYLNSIPVSNYSYAYAIIMNRHGLGQRSGQMTWLDGNGDTLSSNWITALETYEGGACIQEFMIPDGTVTLNAEFDGISNAETAGQSSVIGETYYVKGCYIFITNNKIDIQSDESSLNQEWKTAALDIRKEQGTGLCFGIQSDTHFNMNDPNYVGKQLKDITKLVGFDFVANLGDITRGYSGELHPDSPDNMRIYAETIMSRYTDGICCPFITCIGNHEKNNVYSADHPGVDPFTLAELYAQFTKQTLNTSAKFVGPVGKSYYYIDLSEVRVIALFTNDSDQGSFTVSEAQASWFTNQALNTQLPVLVLSHVPLVDGWNPDNLNYSEDYKRIMTPLEAFKNNGGTVIACIYGHAHRQEAQKKNGIWHIICTRTETQYTTAEFFMVDLSTYNITTIGVGAATSRTFEH